MAGGYSRTAHLARGDASLTRGAVIIGGYINSLGLVRALAARGVPVAVVRTQPYDIAHHSRHVSSHARAFNLHHGPEALLDLLDRKASKWSGWALLPTTDDAIAALAGHYDRLSSVYRVIGPPPDVAAYLLDKSRMLAAADAVGILLPRRYGRADVAAALRPAIHYPVVVKPLTGYRFAALFGTKLFVARNAEELDTCVATVKAAGIPCDLCEFVPGPDSCIYAYALYIDQHGEPGEGVTIRKWRQSPPLVGVARVAQVVEENPVLREATVALLRRMDYRGMAVAEFKVDERDGSCRFIEVNGRSFIYNALVRRAGVDLAAMAWSDCMQGRPLRARRNGWRGIWINLHADVLYALLYRRHVRLGLREFLRPYRGPLIEAVWSVRDPAPFAAQWSHSARDAAAALLTGRNRDRFSDRTTPIRRQPAAGDSASPAA